MSGPGDAPKIYVADTRRRWSLEEKLAIVAETRDSPVSRVARKHGLASGLLFRWRKMLAAEAAEAAEPSKQNFIAVALPAPISMPQDKGAVRDRAGGKIEIVLAAGRRVIVGADVDVDALRRVIAALERA